MLVVTLCIFTEKEKISCLSLIRSKEFDEDFGNDGFIDLYPIKGTKSLISRVYPRQMGITI